MFLKENITNYTNEGKCSNCGHCCTDFLPLTFKEVKRIKAYLKEHPEIVDQQHIVGDSVEVKCAFRDEVNKKCLIYPVKPLICSTFLCSKKQETLFKLRDSIQSKADLNKITKMEVTKLVSTHALFFDNFEWEKSVFFLMSDKDLDRLSELTKHTYFKYNIIKEDK